MLVLTNGNIMTMEDEETFVGSILIDKGKIKDIGKNIEIPDNCEKIDVSGKVVIPGMIDAHTHLGIGEDGLGWEGQDYNEMTDPITPHLRAIDAINPADEGLEEAYKNGITAVMTGPGSANVIGGENLVMKTKGNVIDDMIIKTPAGIKAAFGENPKRVYNEKEKAPSTRMAVAGVMRETLMEVQDYKNRKEKAEKDSEPFTRNIKMESLLRVLNKDIPLKVHAHRADDIMTAIRIANEFDINITLEHCTEGHKVVNKIKKAGLSCIVGPTLAGRVKVELKELSFKTAGVLANAGVRVALMSDHPVIPTYSLPVYAALAFKSGMSERDALKAITINSAQILGVDDRIGSLKKGKDADIVVFSGDPLDVRSQVETVIMDGEVVKTSLK